MEKIKYKLGIDLGSTSLGWAVVDLDDKGNITGLRDLGVRIFPDGRNAKSHTPVNVERRNARTMRRQTDRTKQRIEKVISILRANGMNPDQNKNPYELRVSALDKKISPEELGRAIEHLAVRRGYKSNRKDTSGEGGGKLKNAMEKAKQVLGKYRTLGEYILRERGNARFNDVYDATGKVIENSVLPTRELYIDEFNKICDSQELNGELRKKLYDAIFFQRPMKPQYVGHCRFETGQPRAYKYNPIFQKFRVLETLNQLMIAKDGKPENLTQQQREIILNILLNTFDGVNKKGKIGLATLRKKIGLGKNDGRFNLETENRTEIDADRVSSAMREIDTEWHERDYGEQLKILDILNGDMEDDEASKALSEWYDDRQIEELCTAPFESGTCNLSVLAMSKIIPFMEAGQMYHEACRSVGYHHSANDIEQLDKLPYYGELPIIAKSCVERRIGDETINIIANWTVHIALNQLRIITNELIRRYGKPVEIHIETARDLRAGAREIGDNLSIQSKNQKENDLIANDLTACGIRPNYENIQKVKIWKRLAKKDTERRCPYTGKQIGFSDLFGGQFEIEHILPFSRTFDDSMSNKIISDRDANRWKSNRTPYEAFSASDSPYNYFDVLERASNLPDSTKWRFMADSMERIEKDGGPIARAIRDTEYMTAVAPIYMKHICENPSRVFLLPGQMTSLFREMWNLNFWKEKKNADTYRASHIHHAIDAFVVACMNQGNLQRLAINANRIETEGNKGALKEKRKDLFDSVKPYETFSLPDFYKKCWDTSISYRQSERNPSKMPAGKTIGQLHKETAWGMVDFIKNKNGEYNSLKARFRTRKDTETESEQLSDDGTSVDIVKTKITGRTIKDKDIRDLIPIFRTKFDRDEYHNAFIEWYVSCGIASEMKSSLKNNPEPDKTIKKELKQKIDDQAAKEKLLLSHLQETARRAYKWFISGNNYCSDVFALRDDDKKYPSLRSKWQIEILSNYWATILNGEPLWRKKYPTARRIMRLRANDIIRAEFSKIDEVLPKEIKSVVIERCDLNRSESVQINFRVKKMVGDIVYLRPDYIAKEGDKVIMENGKSYTNTDNKSWRATAESLYERHARKIYVDPIGQITDNGFLE
jgi:CRISPR-associated endonuclease Csn1